jgi:hypothetical protein
MKPGCGGGAGDMNKQKTVNKAKSTSVRIVEYIFSTGNRGI